MRLSPLQKFILRHCYSREPRISRVGFERFYEHQKYVPQRSGKVNIITKSLEALIDRGFLVGYGVRTPQKWYIKEVKLTPLGRKLARKLLGEQATLPFRVGKGK